MLLVFKVEMKVLILLVKVGMLFVRLVSGILSFLLLVKFGSKSNLTLRLLRSFNFLFRVDFYYQSEFGVFFWLYIMLEIFLY